MLSYYEVLGVPPEAKPADVRAAFHAAALKYHPDKEASRSTQGADSMQPVSFEQIKAAYEVLQDSHLRDIHDKELALHTYRQHMNFQDELSLEEMESMECDACPHFS
ncbi:DnaJ domain-containing protein [Dunaliella salina]|uniref:DnaJ domain-containing protein n=1 Tax=Dunaliella salina TaxID=3046 RepID=A0ABQ7G5U3_DUNSA|nr:DnaJ domain-containing protein [Dunaliella salina]|eukprot:KAF5829983.1 DnaJ domain-containing protein [Dunaliella salina]